MGAGARLAEERDKWSDDWQIADLEQEGEHLLALLELAEELRAVVPGVRDGLVGPCARADRCHRSQDPRGGPVAGRGRRPPLRDDPRSEVRPDDVTTAIIASLEEARDGRGTRLGLPGAEFGLDPVALDRLWEHVDGSAGRVRRS